MDRIRRLLRFTPLGVAGAYALFGVLWILFSDRLAERLAVSPAQPGRIQTVAGWLFVLASAGVLYALLRRWTRRVLAATSQARESEARLRLFAGVTTEGLVFVEDGRIRDVNDALVALTRRSREDLLGRPVAELLAEDDRPRLDALLAGRRAAAAEVRLANGHEVEITARAPAPAPALERVVGVRDLRERRTLELQLRQAQKLEAVAHLTAGIAHDFNNVLSVILANADLLRGALPADRPDLRDDLDDLRHAAQGGAAMVRRLMGFSRQAALTLQPTDLRLLLEDLGHMLERLLPATIRVRVRADAGAPCVRADPTTVQQILLNLATNARDAMPDGGTLDLTLEPVELDEAYQTAHPWVEPGPYLCLTVADSGTGMNEETRARVFDPFFTTKAPGEGTGLGLAMVYGLMKQHGGYTNLYSEPGRGTRVSLFFPVSREDPQPGSAGAAGEPRGGSETVLLVEDEAPLRRTGRRVLESLGYRVVTAANGLEALRLLQEGGDRVDLVLSDVSMPEMGGVDLYRALRDRGSPLPFVFASGYSARQMLEALGVRGPLLCVQKPWTLAELAGTLRQALGGSAASN